MVVSDRRLASRSGGFCCYPTGPCLEIPVGPIIRWSVRISGEFTGFRSDSVRLSGRIVYSGGRRQDTAAMVTARVVAVVNVVRSTSDTGQRAVQVQVKQSTGRFGLRVFGSAGFQVSVRCFVYSSDEFHRELTRSTQPSQLGKRQKVNSTFGSAVQVDSLVRISRFRLD
ncbi:hypothetical protein Hdeb2414_s0010g00354021 [Helianthus debilis subsp. tardiflorus]